jgi:hypothetical protein
LRSCAGEMVFPGGVYSSEKSLCYQWNVCDAFG